MCRTRTLTTEMNYDEDLRQVDQPDDQSLEVVRVLAELNGRYAAQQITVGVLDEARVASVQRELQLAGVASRYGPGRTVEASRPLRFSAGFSEFLQEPTCICLSDLLRHPELAHTLQRRLAWSESQWAPSACRAHAFQQDHLPGAPGSASRAVGGGGLVGRSRCRRPGEGGDISSIANSSSSNGPFASTGTRTVIVVESLARRVARTGGVGGAVDGGRAGAVWSVDVRSQQRSGRVCVGRIGSLAARSARAMETAGSFLSDNHGCRGDPDVAREYVAAAG